MGDRTKRVLLVIEVPVGDHCWGPGPQHLICENFDSPGGHPQCFFGLGDLVYSPEGNVLKPSGCLCLNRDWNNR